MKQIQMFIGKLPALLLLVGAIVLMQKHAWDFWKEFDSEFYWLWAVMLEGAALWLWSQRHTGMSAIAFLATLLVLAGPLYQVSKPAVAMWQKSQIPEGTLEDKKARLITDLVDLKASLKTYEKNSETRGGWLPTIQQTKNDIKEKEAKLEEVEKQLDIPVLSWQALAVIAIKLLPC